MSNTKEDKKIRTQWNADEEDWYFSVFDIVDVLTDSLNPRKYWSNLKRKIKKEGRKEVSNTKFVSPVNASK